jgi:hypothetical protein
MTKKLTTLAQMRAALAENGAVLVFDEHMLSRGYLVRHADGREVRCSQVADRLTWGKNAAVTFSHRTPLELYYTPKR